VVKRAHAALAVAAVALAARAADACPACTTRSGGGYMIPLLLGAMILTPYVVATFVLRIVRQAEAERQLDDGSWQPPAGDSSLVTDSGGEIG
jgi:hypothetical protein